MGKLGDFYLGEDAVGQFVEASESLKAGRHLYEPYRGPGHLAFANALGDGQQPRCWSVRGEVRVWFSVTREEFEAKSPQSEWWITIEDVETIEGGSRRLSSQQLAALVVDALADARLVARPKISAAFAIAAEEIEIRKAMGDY